MNALPDSIFAPYLVWILCSTAPDACPCSWTFVVQLASPRRWTPCTRALLLKWPRAKVRILTAVGSLTSSSSISTSMFAEMSPCSSFQGYSRAMPRKRILQNAAIDDAATRHCVRRAHGPELSKTAHMRSQINGCTEDSHSISEPRASSRISTRCATLSSSNSSRSSESQTGAIMAAITAYRLEAVSRKAKPCR